MTNQQDTALLPVAWMYERNDGQHRFVSMDRRGIILGEGPLGYTETSLFAAHRLQAAPSASCEAGEVAALEIGTRCKLCFMSAPDQLAYDCNRPECAHRSAALSSIRSGAGANSSGLADTPAEKG